VSYLLGRFLISHEYFDILSLNFQSIIRELGEYVAGDEKLDYFTGNSGDIRKVPNKPAKISLWHYELVSKIDNKTSYMMDVHTAHVHKQVDESDIMAYIVERWSDCIKRVNKNSNKSTMLCFDSHYILELF
jgi:hypothetical protein